MHVGQKSEKTAFGVLMDSIILMYMNLAVFESFNLFL